MGTSAARVWAVCAVARAVRILLGGVIDVTHRIWRIFLFVFLGLGLRRSLFAMTVFAAALVRVVRGSPATAPTASAAPPRTTSAGPGKVGPRKTWELGPAVVNTGTRSGWHGLEEVEKWVTGVLRRSIPRIVVRVRVRHYVDRICIDSMRNLMDK